MCVCVHINLVSCFIFFLKYFIFFLVFYMQNKTREEREKENKKKNYIDSLEIKGLKKYEK